MRLRTKTLIVIGVTLLSLVGVLSIAASSILLRSLQEAEARDTRQAVRGVQNLLKQTQEDFGARFADWSAWDSTYNFIEDGNSNYIKENLIPQALANLNVNLVIFIHSSGRVVFATGFDPKSEKLTPLPAAIKEHIFLEDLLLQHPHSQSRLTGLFLLPEGPMVITSHPILTSQKTGPIRGTLIFGRYLDADMMKKLSRITRMRLMLYKLNHPQLPAEVREISSALAEETEILVRPLNENTISGYTQVKDIYGQPNMLLRVDIYRDIYKQSKSSLRYLIVSLFLVGAVFGGMTLLLLERLVLSRLDNLSVGVKRIGASGDPSMRLLSQGDDELSSLANSINAMLEALEQSQQKQREGQEQYRAVVEQASEGIFLFDVQTLQILEANPAFQRLLGYSLDEILQLTVYDIADSDRESVDENIQRLLGEKGHSLGERRYRRRDGKRVDVEVSANSISYKGREVMCAVVHDITERKQAEEALRQAEEKYRQIFENASEGIYQRTSDGRYISANSALARIYGYKSAEELIANLTHIEQQLYVDPHRYSKLIATLQKHDAASRFVSQIYRQDGSIIWISENVRAVRDASGALLYYEGTVEDITLRKVAEEALRYQQEQSERLLHNILPGPIAARLKLEESTIADSFAEVTVLFADIVGFTQLASKIPPTEVVSLLNQIFSAFDQLAEQYGLEKIKTIGDAYMVVGGLPMPRSDHAEAIAEMALDMLEAIAQFKTADGQSFNIRIGINTGPVVAGVIGIKKFIYDLWGDTVNMASRMESQGIAGSIQVTSATYERLREQYLFENRGEIFVKGKGEMKTYLLKGRKVYTTYPNSG